MISSLRCKLIRYCYALLQILVTDTKETRYRYVTTIICTTHSLFAHTSHRLLIVSSLEL